VTYPPLLSPSSLKRKMGEKRKSKEILICQKSDVSSSPLSFFIEERR